MEQLKDGCSVRIKGLVVATQHIVTSCQRQRRALGVLIGSDTVTELLPEKPASLEFVREPALIDDSSTVAADCESDRNRFHANTLCTPA